MRRELLFGSQVASQQLGAVAFLFIEATWIKGKQLLYLDGNFTSYVSRVFRHYVLIFSVNGPKNVSGGILTILMALLE